MKGRVLCGRRILLVVRVKGETFLFYILLETYCECEHSCVYVYTLIHAYPSVYIRTNIHMHI